MSSAHVPGSVRLRCQRAERFWASEPAGRLVNRIQHDTLFLYTYFN